MRKLVLLALLASLLATDVGCKAIGAAMFMLRPRQWVDPEFELKGKIAIVIENARPTEENPLFTRALYDTFCKAMEEGKAPVDAVPLETFLRLRQSEPNFSKWGLQRIGRELHAEQVLYIRVLNLRMLESPDAPIVEPTANLSVVVVGVDAPLDKPRLWPDAVEGRTLSVSRGQRDAADPRAVDDEATKLGKDAAHLIARYFHKYDGEEPVTRER